MVLVAVNRERNLDAKSLGSKQRPCANARRAFPLHWARSEPGNPLEWKKGNKKEATVRKVTFMTRRREEGVLDTRTEPLVPSRKSDSSASWSSTLPLGTSQGKGSVLLLFVSFVPPMWRPRVVVPRRVVHDGLGRSCLHFRGQWRAVHAFVVVLSKQGFRHIGKGLVCCGRRRRLGYSFTIGSRKSGQNVDPYKYLVPQGA